MGRFDISGRRWKRLEELFQLVRAVTDLFIFNVVIVGDGHETVLVESPEQNMSNNISGALIQRQKGQEACGPSRALNLRPL